MSIRYMCQTELSVVLRLFSAGLRGCAAAKKPLLLDPTIRKRSASAHEHRDWTIEQLDIVCWSDESSIQRTKAPFSFNVRQSGLMYG